MLETLKSLHDGYIWAVIERLRDMICDEIFSKNTLSGKIIEFRIKI